MKLLFVGDVVGKMGRDQIDYYLPKLKKKYKPQVTIVNGENAAGGRGITEPIYKQLLQAGADVITMGNHTFDNRDIFNFIEETNKLIRPANYPVGTPGKGMTTINVNQTSVSIINLQGRVYLNDLDDPFRKIDDLLDEALAISPYVFIDFHAEVTSEKQAMGWYVDGRASAIVGTHTHVQTNDARIFPQGTGYLTDVGMTGPNEGILGVRRDIIINKFLTQLPQRHEIDEAGSAILSAVVIELNNEGKTTKLIPIRIDQEHPFIE